MESRLRHLGPRTTGRDRGGPENGRPYEGWKMSKVQCPLRGPGLGDLLATVRRSLTARRAAEPPESSVKILSLLLRDSRAAGPLGPGLHSQLERLLLGRRGLPDGTLPFDHKIGCRRRPGITDAVHLVGCLKDDRPWSNLAAHSVEGGFDSAFLDQNHLLIDVVVGGVR